ncbi:type II secretion system major pseudopilin GspG [Bacteriovorax sp. PP10]|uniref:Type II secretion system major pseudopilin GspG n=1 Tax=Bacteriovorax antarcticus TaxID=3088717 RepID=A0ABU5VXY0_9BACT|nr:type II secretion system major pseudopilin GspG [Bacteriovorax sp. PP10]MEA9357928.1 type II secretion system major pseudopilin GspG [Bacteriovorax sp. PP10]
MENTSFEKALVQNQKGFSLIEILIALTLLAVAGTFVVGRFMDTLNEGQVKSTKIQMNGLDARLKEFRRKCGFYPTTEQGLESLMTKPTGGRECKDYPANGFIDGESVPKDPWDNDFIYESDGKTFNIYSYGPDGEAGGEGTDSDIYLKAGKGGAAAGGGSGAEAGAEAPAAE